MADAGGTSPGESFDPVSPPANVARSPRSRFEREPPKKSVGRFFLLFFFLLYWRGLHNWWSTGDVFLVVVEVWPEKPRCKKKTPTYNPSCSRFFFQNFNSKDGPVPKSVPPQYSPSSMVVLFLKTKKKILFRERAISPVSTSAVFRWLIQFQAKEFQILGTLALVDRFPKIIDEPVKNVRPIADVVKRHCAKRWAA